MDMGEKQGGSLKRKKKQKNTPKAKPHHFASTIQALSKDPACHTHSTACSPMLLSANSPPMPVFLCSATLALSLCWVSALFPGHSPCHLPVSPHRGMCSSCISSFPALTVPSTASIFCFLFPPPRAEVVPIHTADLPSTAAKVVKGCVLCSSFCSYQEKMSVL